MARPSSSPEPSAGGRQSRRAASGMRGRAWRGWRGLIRPGEILGEIVDDDLLLLRRNLRAAIGHLIDRDCPCRRGLTLRKYLRAVVAEDAALIDQIEPRPRRRGRRSIGGPRPGAPRDQGEQSRGAEKKTGNFTPKQTAGEH